MLYCSGCGKQLPDGIKVCEACGTPAPIECPQCGTKISAGAAYCFNCGLAAPSAKSGTATAEPPVFAYEPAEPAAPAAAPAESFPVFEIPEQSADYQTSSISTEQAYGALQGTDYLSGMYSSGTLSAETESPFAKKKSKKRFGFGRSETPTVPEFEYRPAEPAPVFVPPQPVAVQPAAQTAEQAYLAAKNTDDVQQSTAEASDEAAFLSSETVAPVKAKPQRAGAPSGMKRKPSLKAVIIAAAALVLAVSVALGSMLIGGKVESIPYGIFQKDGEIWLTMFNGTPAVQVTSGSVSRYISGAFTVMSKDGSKLFYADRYVVDNGLDTATVNCLNVNDGSQYTVDTDMHSGYIVSETGDRVTYLKGADRTLYQHDSVASVKLASKVRAFSASENGERVIYLTSSKELYLAEIGVQTRRLASSVSSLSYFNEDLSAVVYIADNILYCYDFNSDSTEEIAKDVHRVAKAYSEDSFYFYQKEEYKKKIIDFVIDDMAVFDENLGGTTLPEEPDPDEYDSVEEYQQAYDYFEEAFLEYYTNYWDIIEKSKREELRKELSELVLFTDKLSLCYFDGGSVTKVSDSVGFLMAGGSSAGTFEYGTDGVNCAADSPVVVFCSYDESDVKKVALTKIENSGGAKAEIANGLLNSGKCSVAVEETVTELEKNSSEFVFTADGSKLYYWVGSTAAENVDGELYSSAISGGKAGRAVMNKETLVYYKNFSDYSGDLYLNGEKKDSSVSISNGLIFCEKTEVFYYFTGWSSLYNTGELRMISAAGEVVNVAAGVYGARAVDNGVMYINDYSASRMCGPLYFHDSKNSVLIDEKVTAFPVFLSYEDRYKINL